MTNLNLILTRQLQSAFDGLGTSARKEDGAAFKRRAGEFEKLPRELFRHLGGEVAGVCELQPRRLLAHDARDLRVTVPDKIDYRARREVEIFLASAVEQPHAFAADGNGIRFVHDAMQDGRARNLDRRRIFLHGRIIPRPGVLILPADTQHEECDDSARPQLSDGLRRISRQ